MDYLEDKVKSYEALIDSIKNQSFWIYGYGGVAKRFFRCIKCMGAGENLRGFMVSHVGNGDKRTDILGEYPVISVEVGEREALILIAVDVFNIREIYSTLINLKYKNFFWIYFNLYDLEFGLPVQKNVLLDVDWLFRSSYWADWIATCYLVIEDVFSKREDNRDIYIKFSSIWLDNKTAIKDWERFSEKMLKCVGQGYKKDYNIKISKDKYIVIDGAHRVAIAKYYGIDEISADIYNVTKHDFNAFRPGIKNWDFSYKPWEKFLTGSELKRISNVFNRT